MIFFLQNYKINIKIKINKNGEFHNLIDKRNNELIGQYTKHVSYCPR